MDPRGVRQLSVHEYMAMARHMDEAAREAKRAAAKRKRR
jgi:hypothetical protein